MNKETDIEKLRKLLIFGSPAARAAALTLLDEATGGRLLRELLQKLRGVDSPRDRETNA